MNNTTSRPSRRSHEKKSSERDKTILPSTEPSAGQDATSDPAFAPSYETASHALNLRDMAAAGWIYWITSTTLSEKINPDAFKLYRDIILHEAGNPTDPIERMLIEQLALAHFSIGQLRIRACATENPKMAIAFSDAATRLLSELRRCSLALEDYRAKQAARAEMSRTEETKEEAAAQPAIPPRPSSNGKRRSTLTEVANTGNGDMPEWLMKRMAYPTLNGSTPAAAGNGHG